MNIFEFDKDILNGGELLLCGVDEAGRGPLAGPVYAAAVILPRNIVIDGLNDSKKLTPKKRELLYDEITNKAVSYAIASVAENEIDEINILNAAMLAMRKAVASLEIKPELVLVDGNSDPGFVVNTRLITGGDAKSACIAAASVLAKVARDRYMLDLHEKYPVYRFDKHKGYGTKLHYEILDSNGPCEAHRQSFLKKWRENMATARCARS